MALQFKSGFKVVALVVVAWTSLGSGQTLLPTPEHQKMGYFAGDWKLQGTMRISPNTPGGPFTAKEHAEWVTGGFFLETHSSMTSVLGDTRSTRMMEYNADDKIYTYNSYNSLGEHQMATGHILDNTWTWTSEAKMNGLIAKGRYTITVVSPVVYTFTYETLTQTGAWATVMEGKATRSP
jgi:hypothetical protein